MINNEVRIPGSQNEIFEMFKANTPASSVDPNFQLPDLNFTANITFNSNTFGVNMNRNTWGGCCVPPTPAGLLEDDVNGAMPPIGLPYARCMADITAGGQSQYIKFDKPIKREFLNPWLDDSTNNTGAIFLDPFTAEPPPFAIEEYYFHTPDGQVQNGRQNILDAGALTLLYKTAARRLLTP